MLSVRNISKMALAAGAGLLVVSIPTGASAENEWPPKTVDQLPVESEKNGENDAKDLVLKIHKIERTSNNMAILTWSVINKGSSHKRLEDIFINDEYEYASHRQLSAVSLIDKKEKVEYEPLMDSGKDCLCAQMDNSNHPRSIDEDEIYSGYSAYFVEKNTKNVSVKIKNFPEFKDIPIK